MNGHLHPLTQFLRLSLGYFIKRGFEVLEGPELETEWYNFDALNVPATHPSRDVQDTFWTKDGRLLRTHTTATDIRLIKENNLKPPLRLIIPGRCFRNEATDQIHEHTFYQIDGIAIDAHLSMAHLIGLLEGYIKEIFGSQVKIRLRPHFYPFVEPGMDMDVWVPETQNAISKLTAPALAKSKGRWEEVIGAGMAHPVVLKNAGLDPNKWQGIMWGMGVDRLMMQYFKINDIRLSYSGDLRFLKQF